MQRRPTVLNRRQVLQRAGAWGLAGASLPMQVDAAVFMEIDQAQKLLLPQADSYEPVTLVLDENKLSAIAAQSETRVSKNFAPRVWQAKAATQALGWVVADRVIGKYDWIDYAVAFSPEGAVLGVEILAYRESHGAEIRQAAWRKQFMGRASPQSLRFGDDIRHISGATLSCQHVTEGVQRLSALVGLLKSKR
jgi:Na+-translocating ferredoxin:NAD+ oxidoreductase RnfG subunit